MFSSLPEYKQALAPTLKRNSSSTLVSKTVDVLRNIKAMTTFQDHPRPGQSHERAWATQKASPNRVRNMQTRYSPQAQEKHKGNYKGPYWNTVPQVVYDESNLVMERILPLEVKRQQD